MANEAILVYRNPGPVNCQDFIVADATAVAKGAVMILSDPMTAAIATNGAVPVAGIAAREKVASDGRTRLALYIGAGGEIFRMYASGSITAGQAVIVAPDATTYPNFVAVQGPVVSGAFKPQLGTALETATNGQQLLVVLKPITTLASQ